MKLTQLLDYLPERLSDWLSPTYVVNGEATWECGDRRTRIGVASRKRFTDDEAMSLLVAHMPYGFTGRINYLGTTRL